MKRITVLLFVVLTFGEALAERWQPVELALHASKCLDGADYKCDTSKIGINGHIAMSTLIDSRAVDGQFGGAFDLGYGLIPFENEVSLVHGGFHILAKYYKQIQDDWFFEGSAGPGLRFLELKSSGDSEFKNETFTWGTKAGLALLYRYDASDHSYIGFSTQHLWQPAAKVEESIGSSDPVEIGDLQMPSQIVFGLVFRGAADMTKSRTSSNSSTESRGGSCTPQMHIADFVSMVKGCCQGAGGTFSFQARDCIIGGGMPGDRNAYLGCMGGGQQICVKDSRGNTGYQPVGVRP